MRESEVWQKFRNTWPLHAERQEPGLGNVDSGKPDVLLLDRNGKPGLVELKAPDRFRLRPTQWLWHERWVTWKGKVAVVTCDEYEDGFFWHVCSVTLEELRARRIAKGERLDGREMRKVLATALGLVV